MVHAMIVKQDGRSVTVFQGEISGGVQLIQVDNIAPGDIFVVSFPDLSAVVSPVSEIWAKYEEFARGCATSHMHGIQSPIGVPQRRLR